MMDTKSNKYLSAYMWIFRADSDRWYEMNEEQEKILKEIYETSNSPLLPEIHFGEGRVKIIKWKNGKPVKS